MRVALRRRYFVNNLCC